MHAKLCFIYVYYVVGGESLDFVRCVSYSRHLAVGQLIAFLITPQPVTTFYKGRSFSLPDCTTNCQLIATLIVFRVAPSSSNDGATPFLFLALYKPDDCLIQSVVTRHCSPSVTEYTTIQLPLTTIGECASFGETTCKINQQQHQSSKCG